MGAASAMGGERNRVNALGIQEWERGRDETY